MTVEIHDAEHWFWFHVDKASQVSNEDHRRLMDALAAFNARCQSPAVIYTCAAGDGSMPNAVQREDFARAISELDPERIVGIVVVTPKIMQRGLFKAIMWVARPSVSVKAVASVEEALAHIAAVATPAIAGELAADLERAGRLGDA